MRVGGREGGSGETRRENPVNSSTSYQHIQFPCQMGSRKPP